MRARVPQQEVVSRCERTRHELDGAGGRGDVAHKGNGFGTMQPNDGFVRTGGDVVFHLEVLKLALPKGDVSNASFWRENGKAHVAGP
jgi:hypothetical protein